MSSVALLILALAIFTITGITALLFGVLERLTRRRLRSTRYSSELPTWGMLCREAMAREYVQANKRKPGLLLRELAQARRDNEVASAVTGEPHPANISQRLPTNS